MNLAKTIESLMGESLPPSCETATDTPRSEMVSYDKMEWHYGGQFPEDLPDERGGTHIGIFLAWCVLHDLDGDLHRKQTANETAALRARKITGRQFLQNACGEKFTSLSLNETGQQFCQTYYLEEHPSSCGSYMDDYCSTLAASLSTAYHVEDTWENYDLMETVIDKKFEIWKHSKERG